jgi:alkylation response protein AidB-like acyl-CoA dehydrogenase
VAAELAELRESAGDILRQAWSVEQTRMLLDGPEPAFDGQLWNTISSLGWANVLVAESDGGEGGDLRQLCVLSEAVGTATAPVPLAATAAAHWCEQRCTDGIALLLDTPGTTMGDGVSGTWAVVPYGSVATKLLVLADRDGDTTLVAIDPNDPRVIRESVCPLDHNPAARITVSEAPFEVLAEGPEAVRRHQHGVFRARLAAVAEVVGIASAANQAAVDYAKVRVAFGRPIGTFQAIKHRLVDQRTSIEVGRALVNRAADACQHDHAETAALVSLAAFWALDSLRKVPEGVTQVFGGIGYTWEHEAHVYLRRCASVVATLGSRPEHRAAVAGWLTSRGTA